MSTEFTSDTQSYVMFKGQHVFSYEIEQKGIAYACFNVSITIMITNNYVENQHVLAHKT